MNGIIKTLDEKLCSPGFFEGAPAGIAFANGFLLATVDGVELLPHSPENKATMRLDFPYDPTVKALRFEQFLRDVFRDDEDAAEKIALLQEHAGACLLGIAAKYQLAIVMLGLGANGKSTYLDISTGVFPDEWKASIPPHAWSHEYNRSLLPGIRINAVNELPDRELMASEMIKAIISGDEIQARVIREQPFTFRPVAGQLFAANDLPAVTDQSHGLWRRLAIVSFNRVFAEHEMVRGLAEPRLHSIHVLLLFHRADLLGPMPPQSGHLRNWWCQLRGSRLRVPFGMVRSSRQNEAGICTVSLLRDGPQVKR